MPRFSTRELVSFLNLLALGLLSAFSAAAVSGDVISGSAHNQSRRSAAIGDEVILVRLDQTPDRGMQQEAHARTDAHGAFTFHVQYSDRPYLVRVIHEGVTYDGKASVGDQLSIPVFDSAPLVSSINGSIEILRVGTRGNGENLLHVSDMYEIRNESRPPMTQSGARTFDVYLPTKARIDSVLAAGPGTGSEKIGVMISAVPVVGEPGHYTVSFPLRPGATKFAFNYDLPYQGHAVFQTRREYGFQQFAVMIPPSMKFSSSTSAFQELATGDKEYKVRAAIQVKAGRGPEFEVSGDGALPSLQAETHAQQQSPIPGNSTLSGSASTLPPLSARSDSQLETASSSSLSQWLLLTGGVLIACAVMVLRVRKKRVRFSRGAVVEIATPPQPSERFLEGLKEELFQLEADRIRGSIGAEEYASARQALEETVKRVVARVS
jgi:hypothetical protein